MSSNIDVKLDVTNDAVPLERGTPASAHVDKMISMCKRHHAFRFLRAYQSQAGCPASSRWAPPLTEATTKLQLELLQDRPTMTALINWALNNVAGSMSPFSLAKVLMSKCGEIALTRSILSLYGEPVPVAPEAEASSPKGRRNAKTQTPPETPTR